MKSLKLRYLSENLSSLLDCGGDGCGVVAFPTFKGENVLKSLSEKPTAPVSRKAAGTLLTQHWTEAGRRPQALQGAREEFGGGPTELLPGETDSLLLYTQATLKWHHKVTEASCVLWNSALATMFKNYCDHPEVIGYSFFFFFFFLNLTFSKFFVVFTSRIWIPLISLFLPIHPLPLQLPWPWKKRKEKSCCGSCRVTQWATRSFSPYIVTCKCSLHLRSLVFAISILGPKWGSFLISCYPVSKRSCNFGYAGPSRGELPLRSLERGTWSCLLPTTAEERVVLE